LPIMPTTLQTKRSGRPKHARSAWPSCTPADTAEGGGAPFFSGSTRETSGSPCESAAPAGAAGAGRVACFPKKKSCAEARVRCFDAPTRSAGECTGTLLCVGPARGLIRATTVGGARFPIPLIFHLVCASLCERHTLPCAPGVRRNAAPAWAVPKPTAG
jgi:hypothetical protein